MDRSEIERVARSGDVQAQIALGQQFEREGNHAMARGFFANVAKTGTQGALRMLALNLLLYEPHQPTDGIQMLRIAGEQGDPEALYFCAMVSARDELLNDRYNVVLNYLRQAAAKGHAQAQAELLLMTGDAREAATVTDWHALSGNAGLDSWESIQHRKVLSETPYIEIFENFIRPEICNWFIHNARPKLTRATVYDPKTGTSGMTYGLRTNTAAEFPFFVSNAIFTMVQAKIIAAANARSLRLEDPSVLHYDVGEEFGQHFDFLDPEEPAYAPDIARKGQRVSTFLVYLNDEFDGGETDFPRAKIRCRGKKGDAILFHNVDADGNPDRNTLHAGLAPTSGEKWLLSQWVRKAPAGN